MTTRLFYLLTIAAAVTFSLAAVTYSAKRSATSSIEAGTALFEGLTGRQEEIGRLTVTQGGESINIVRAGEGWGIEERNGFPASANEIRETIVGMTQMYVVEAKTSNDERYHLLSLEDPTLEDANSKMVQLFDDEGNVVAEVVLGKIKYGLLGPGRNGVYVRVPGDPQTWLVSGDVNAPLDVRGWAAKGVYEFSEDDVARVAISHSDGEVLVYEREDVEGETSFRIANLPEGFEMKANADLEFDVRSVSQLELWDVRSSSGAHIPEGADEVTVDVLMLDGTSVTAHVVSENDDEYWVSVFAWGTGEVSEAAEAINSRARGWQFQIQTYKANYFIKRLEDVAELQDGEEEGS